MSSDLLTGLVLLGVGIAMFFIALPRHGEVVRFLRYRDGLQAFYVMVFILLICLGGTITLSHWN
jgi:hypothetical protein